MKTCPHRLLLLAILSALSFAPSSLAQGVDTDGDGLPDSFETNTGIFTNPENTGTDPNNSDTDGDGLADNIETGSDIFVSAVNTGTDPNKADTDGDLLSDGDELNPASGYKSNPLLPDTDGDTFNDKAERDATPPSNPWDPTSVPGGAPVASRHAIPVQQGASQQLEIDESFAPFGHRPERDKVGDDGSAAIIDSNGVLIWTNSAGEALTVPGATFAKTLYVTNTECVVYNSRFKVYNTQDEVAEVVIHRRDSVGAKYISKTTVNVPGTLLDAPGITPTTYGFTVISGQRSDDGAESTQVPVQVTIGGSPPVTDKSDGAPVKVDVWDILTLRLNQITWDGEVRPLEGVNFSIPKNGTANFTNGQILSYGPDGSLLVAMSTAATDYDKWDDSDPGEFASELTTFWVSAIPGRESISAIPDTVVNAAYVDNTRAIVERFTFTGLDLVDIRKSPNSSIIENDDQALNADERLWAISQDTAKISGIDPLVYTLDDTTAATPTLRAYRCGDTLAQFGTDVVLPNKVLLSDSAVVNPRDGSLLVKAGNSGLLWIPATTTGFGTPVLIPNTQQAKPLFVSKDQAIAWINGEALPLNGALPPVELKHYQLLGGAISTSTPLTPPIEGNYVMLPHPLTPDPDLEGWFIRTFEKNSPTTTLLRNYKLNLATKADIDVDGVSDVDELAGTFGAQTDPFDPDTDDDGLSDGRELLPFAVVSGSLGWEEARLAAIEAGGRLAVLDGADQQNRFAAWLVANKPTGAYWVGGHDTIQEGSFRWLDVAGGKSGPFVSNPKNWISGPYWGVGDADGMQVSSNANYKWSMAPISTKQSYIIEFTRTSPVESNLDSDKDGILDDQEINVHGTNPYLADSDFDGLTDKEELFPIGTTPATNPLNADSDNDGYSDFTELRATPATNPNNAFSMPLGFAPTGTNNRIQQGFSPSEIPVSATWTPVLQRTDQTKWGDDGSAVYADANGLLLWRNKDGVVRVIPNSSKAIPLLVSNQKVIVWHNAFNNLLDTPPGNGAGIDPLEVYLYRATANGGTALDKIISDGANQKISGLNVIATAPITTTSQAYHLITTDPDTTYIYRLTFTGDVQAVSNMAVPDGREPHRAYGFGSDGSYVGGVPLDTTYWIRATVPGITSGVWEPLWGEAPEVKNVVPPNEPRRIIYTSNTRVVYEELSDLSEGMNIFSASRFDDVVTITAFNHGLSVGQLINIKDVDIPNVFNPNDINGNYTVTRIISKDQFEYKLGIQAELRRQAYNVTSAKLILPGIKSYNLVESRRNQFTGFGADYNISTGSRKITLADPDYFRVLQISTQTVEGDTRWVYALTKAQNELIVYRLTNVAMVPVYRAELPEGTFLDEYATVEKINPADGSAVITSENIDNLIWVHNSNSADKTKNALLIPESPLAKGMFVSGSQLVAWHNAYDGTDGPSKDGMLNKTSVRHYRQNNGSFVKQPSGADYTDLSSSIQGTFVMATPIFSPSASEWNFWTIDKPTQTSTKALMRNYKLSDNANNDSDGDGIPDIIENKNGTSSALYDTDGDGLTDSDELAYGTDPLLVDTDDDGVSDYQEVVILFTDPNGGSFAASSAGSAVSFSEGRGKYEGLLYSGDDGLGFKLTLNVTAKGAFSGSLEGNFGKAPLRGKLMGDGTWSGRITRGNVGFLRMKLAEQDDGSYGVQGSLETPTGGIYYYQARRAIGFPSRKLTSEASAIDDAAGPTGSAVATGGIGKGGKVTQQIYNPDGSRATYAGSVLEGEFMALYARTKGGVPTVMLGNVALRNNPAGKSNFDGIVRLFNRNYDQERSLSGAYYSPPTMGTLPLPAMSLTANNALLSWSDGRFDGVNKVASWMPNKVTVPTTQNDKATPVYDRKTGLLKLTYTRTDPAKGLINARSNAFAVVVQGKDKLSGFYSGAGSWGGFAVQENSAGLQPDFTNISSLNKTVSAGSISYNVDVTSNGDWTVDTTGASWVTASVKSGTGSGTVVITVNANASNARREASIRIAGFKHTITQSYR